MRSSVALCGAIDRERIGAVMGIGVRKPIPMNTDVTPQLAAVERLRNLALKRVF